jgi:hypothetical protein
VSFSHPIEGPPIGTASPFSGIIVNGRVDHGIGRVLTPYPNSPRKRRFHSLLLAVEAKKAFNLGTALPQLVVYLACLRQSRLSRGRSDTSVFGVASDGYKFVFVTISHGGELRQSREFDIGAGNMVKVLGCLKYVLERSVKMSPNSTPEKGEALPGDYDEMEDDPNLAVDNNSYLAPTESDEED